MSQKTPKDAGDVEAKKRRTIKVEKQQQRPDNHGSAPRDVKHLKSAEKVGWWGTGKMRLVRLPTSCVSMSSILSKR